MKKRILSALLSAVIGVMSIGAASVAAEERELILSDTTKVNMENTDTCFAKVTDSEYHVNSNYYMHFKSEGDWLEVAQNLTETAVAGGQYILTVVAKPISGRVWFRVGWDDTAWMVVEQSDAVEDLGDGWYRYVKEITMTADQTNILFHNDAEFGTAEFYVDSMSLKPMEEDKELIPNGGFDSVSYDSTTEITTANNTTVNVANTDTMFAKVEGELLSADNEYSLHFKTGGDWLEVSQNLTETATAGSQYVLTAYVKPVTGRVWFYVDWDATGWMATHAADVIAPQPDGWTMVQKTITMTEDKSKLLFHNDGATEMYIDDISLVAVGGTENLVPDGGFGEVTIGGVVSDTGTPDEDLILSNTTTVNVTNTDTVFAKVTDNAKNSGNYSMHIKTTGDWVEVAQRLTENAVTGEKYLISAYVKPVTGRVYFRLGWDNDAWMAADSSLGTDWVKVEKEVTVAGNEGDLNTILFHGDGAAEFYIDDLSLVKVGETTELVPDGGFEEVKLTACTGEHVWDEGVVTQEPTTEAEGEKTYTCTVCIQTKTEVIEKIPVEPDIADENLILSDTTHINVANTDTCFAKVTDNEKAGGSYSLHFKATANDWLEVDQTLTEGVTAGGTYIISASLKVVSGKVWFRIGWDDTGWLVSNQTDLGTDLGNGWVKLVKEVTLTGDQTKLLFHNDGEAEMYIDDISLKAAGSDTELVPDGGFEEVTVFEDIPDEDLILSDKTQLNQDNTDTCFAKVTDNEKNSGNYSLHLKAGAADWMEVTQNLTETATAGGQYVFTAYIKPTTGKVWFRLNWDDTAWMVSNQEGTVQANGWTKIEKTITLTADQTKLLFHNDGETEMYIDDISLVAVDGTENLIPDGGFEDVTVYEEVVIPEGPENEYVLTSTRINVENYEPTAARYVEATDEVKHSGNYSLHIKTGADYLEFAQDYTEALTAGAYTLTWYAVGEGRIWFYSNWGTEVNPEEYTASHVVDSAEIQADGWTKYTKVINIDGVGDTSFLFCADGAVDMCIDDISLVDAGGVDYISDGGFEDVKLRACTGEHVWDEGVVTQEPTADAEGVKTFTCTVCVATKTEAIEKLPSEPTYVSGDATGDNMVDTKDVIMIRRSIAGGYGVTINVQAADVTGDGNADTKDVIMIRRFITGGYGVEL